MTGLVWRLLNPESDGEFKIILRGKSNEGFDDSSSHNETTALLGSKYI